MGREIKYRGLSVEGNNWRYGFLLKSRSSIYIHYFHPRIYEVFVDENICTEIQAFPIGLTEIIEGTESQYTGLKDRNGKEIYEGDILSDWTETDEGIIKSFMQVYWNDEKGAWCLDHSYSQDKSSGDLLTDELFDGKYEITGNIHQTPELLKAKK